MRKKLQIKFPKQVKKLWGQELYPDTIEQLNEYKTYLDMRTFDALLNRLMDDQYLVSLLKTKYPEIYNELKETEG